MEFYSILDQKEVIKSEAARDVFFEDLNLQQIIDEIGKVWGKDVFDFYRYFPPDKEAEQYRREITGDVLIPGVFDALSEAYGYMEQRKLAKESREQATQIIQKRFWLVTEVSFFAQAIISLNEGLKSCDVKSKGLGAFKSIINGYAGSKSFSELSKTAFSIRSELEAAKMLIVYDNGRMVLSEVKQDCESQNQSELLNALKRLYPDNPAVLSNPFSGNDELVGIERELFAVYMKKNPELFKRIDAFCSSCSEYAGERIFKFFDEIPFYLSFVKFMRMMEKEGAVFSIPTENADDDIKAENLYDLALYISNSKRGGNVVSNAFCYDKNERFFVLTGPNQGGKTTFARSLGQLVFFGKMGLCVPAKSANLHFFSGIMTHFSVEESVETGRGKLMEELVRLKPMMENCKENTFVIINELFTTAANYDAIIMGKRVLSHFIERGCHGIYVTHLSELLEGNEMASGLCAQLNDDGVQTFKILKKVMEYTNCAANQVNKYGLTYEKIKERLS